MLPEVWNEPTKEETMNRTLVLLGVSFLSMLAGAIGATYVSAQSAPQITRTEILRKPMTGLENKEVVVFLADIPPGGVAATHYHPGDEAIYMLQGALRFEPDQEQPFELKAGQITFNPAKHIHKATNMSATEPAKVLNCMIAEKGQPLATTVQ
jgi:quercetin dioxygenase-like cupin family protein